VTTRTEPGSRRPRREILRPVERRSQRWLRSGAGRGDATLAVLGAERVGAATRGALHPGRRTARRGVDTRGGVVDPTASTSRAWKRGASSHGEDAPLARRRAAGRPRGCSPSRSTPSHPAPTTRIARRPHLAHARCRVLASGATRAVTRTPRPGSSARASRSSPDFVANAGVGILVSHFWPPSSSGGAGAPRGSLPRDRRRPARARARECTAPADLASRARPGRASRVWRAITWGGAARSGWSRASRGAARRLAPRKCSHAGASRTCPAGSVPRSSSLSGGPDARPPRRRAEHGDRPRAFNLSTGSARSEVLPADVVERYAWRPRRWGRSCCSTTAIRPRAYEPRNPAHFATRTGDRPSPDRGRYMVPKSPLTGAVACLNSCVLGAGPLRYAGTTT